MLFAVVSLLGCDPGIFMHPVGWKHDQDPWWSKDVGPLQLRINSLGGLVGSTWVVPEVVVANRSNELFVIEGGTLRTKAETYEIALPGKGEEKWRSVAPH